MSTATENQQPPNSSSSLREVVARHPMVAFLVISFAFGWGGMLPLLLSENGPFGVFCQPSCCGCRSPRYSLSTVLRCRPSPGTRLASKG
jgi:hypothetical protein